MILSLESWFFYILLNKEYNSFVKQTKKTINNHFIQKGFAKNFANNGIIKWTRYQPNENILEDQTFSINSNNVADQPIVIQNFHTQEIEDGMNEIESEGINVIRKIAYEANNNLDEKIRLNRKELYALKFYKLLSSIRTEKARSNFENLNGDKLFNYVIENTDRTPKEIQEDEIKIIIDEYKRWKNKEKLLSSNYDPTKDSLNHKTIIFQLISNILNSRLLFMSFEKNKLFLQETISFQEIYSVVIPIYEFMSISPNVGIMFYFDPAITRGTIKREDSKIFKTKISTKINKVDYVRSKEMHQELDKFMKNQIKLNPGYSQNDILKWQSMFTDSVLNNYFDNNDSYIYEINEESEEVQDICNAMSLVHNKNKILIYQDKRHIKDAEFYVKKFGISRVEDSVH